MSFMELAQPENFRRPQDMSLGGQLDLKPGSFIWGNPVTGKVCKGTGWTPQGGVYPTWREEIVDAFDFDKTVKGLENGDITDAESIFDSFNKQLYEDQRNFVFNYMPRWRRGMSFEEATADIKSQSNAGGTISGETFSALKDTQVQIAGVNLPNYVEHFLTNLVEIVRVEKLHPIGYLDFTTQNQIHKHLGEFEVPWQGSASATTKSWSIERYGMKFAIGEEYYLYDYPGIDILGYMQTDIARQLALAQNEEVYAKMVSSDVTTLASVGGSWSAYTTGISDANPQSTFRALYNALEALGGTVEYVVSNRNIYEARELNTYIKGAISPRPNVNPGRDVLDLPSGNGQTGATLLNVPWTIDSMLSDANGVIAGMKKAIKLGIGPSFTRTYTDDKVGIRGVINKWFFGGYVFDGLLVRRITGAA